MSSVSVIIPSYNYARFLPGCVQSVLTQEDVEVEVLVIDDCSSDETDAVGQELAIDPRVTFRRHEVNKGHIATYNEGFDWASADYVALLSADDLLTPGALKRATMALDSRSTAGLVYGRSVYFVSNDAIPPARTGEPLPCLWPGRDWIAERCKVAVNCISSPEVVVRTSLQRELGGYRADLPQAGDLEMWLRFAAHADIIYLRRVDQAFYRRHSQSMMRTTNNFTMTDLQQRRLSFDALFLQYGSRLSGAEHLHSQANKALAKDALWSACRAFDRRPFDQVEVEALEEFAMQTYPDYRTLSEYRGLNWRRRVGPRWCPFVQPLLPSHYVHKARNILWWRHWREFGV
jgi:hypothetical protein